MLTPPDTVSACERCRELIWQGGGYVSALTFDGKPPELTARLCDSCYRRVVGILGNYFDGRRVVLEE